MGHLANRPEL